MPTLEQAQAHESKIYYEFSHLYDRIFARVFFPRIERVIQSLKIPPGARVLEVGVGTGLSFTAYPPHCQVTGIDLAPEMLEQAQEKIDANGWRHLQVMEMDALNLKFADDSFDLVTAIDVLEHIEADYVCVGHTHQQFVLPVNGTQVVNPGSIGRAYNHAQDEASFRADAAEREQTATSFRFGTCPMASA